MNICWTASAAPTADPEAPHSPRGLQPACNIQEYFQSPFALLNKEGFFLLYFQSKLPDGLSVCFSCSSEVSELNLTFSEEKENTFILNKMEIYVCSTQMPLNSK